MTRASSGLDEFLSQGYITPSDRTIRLLRSSGTPYKKFITGIRASGGNRYTIFDLIGERRARYYYNPDRKELFRQYLESRFKAANPNPTSGMIQSFSKLLDDNGLD